MVSEKRPIEDRTRQDDRIKVLLALTVRQRSPAGPCPPAEQLAAFVDGRLSRAECDEMLEHLDACPSCYRQWLAVSSISAGELKARSGFDLLSFFRAGKRRVGMASGFAMALAACLILFLWPVFHSTSDVENLITESYRNVIRQEIMGSSGELGKKISLPREADLLYGFGYAKRYSPATRAFGAGLWTGKRKLIGEKDSRPLPDFLSPKQPDKSDIKAEEWPETEWAVYFWMGKWCALLKGICLPEAEKMPYNFWKQQGLILDQMQKDFETRSETEKEAGIVNVTLGSVKSVLKDSGQEPIGKRKCREIGSELEILIQRMGL